MDASELREMLMAFRDSRILLTAYELDVFTCIGRQSLDSMEISKRLKLNHRATERLLNALVALELLRKEKGKFTNTELSQTYLSADSPSYMAGFMHTNHLWNTWSQLTEVVKTGEAVQQVDINNRGDQWLSAFIHAMHDRGMKQAPSQVAKIDLQGVHSMLDVGGGSGCYSMAFIQSKPTLKAVIFDLPNVVPISRAIVEKEGFAGQIEFYAGDYTQNELPQGYDLAFLSAIVHGNSSEINQELIRKCYRALNPNGQIVIQDWIMNDDKTEPVAGAIFSINMLVGVNDGGCYSEKEVSDWLTHAGFTASRRVRLDGGLSQMIAVKK